MKFDADTLTAIGVILSLIVGSAGLWIGIRNSRKTIFINSITTARIKYIQDIKSSIAEFCGLYYNYLSIKPLTNEEQLKIIAKADQLKYLITLQLNPEDIEWDRRIINCLNEIRHHIQLEFSAIDQPYLDKKIEELISISQYLLKLEWEGAKRESQKGIISKKEKNKLYRKYLRLYNEHEKKKERESLKS